MTSNVVGVCNVCRKIVTRVEWEAHSHPCKGFYVDTSWNALVNPTNEAWLPGYRFNVMQPSKNGGARSWRMTARTYQVFFEIDRDGLLRHVGGPRPTEHTLKGVEALYARERPGSNGGPPLDD